MTILFLCSGNMHRSPLAEAMLKAEIQRDGRRDLEVLSAGTLAIEGVPAVQEAVELAEMDGLDLSSHRSRPASAGDLARADLILVMEGYHRDWLASNHPEALDRCRILSEYAGPHNAIRMGEDVPDAIGLDRESFRRSYGIIRDCVKHLYRGLPAAPQEIYTRAVEERLRLRRRTPLTMSPADYDLLDRWWSRGVPLWIILESLDELLGRKEGSGDSGRVRRLAYCEEDIEERFAAYLRSRTSAEGEERLEAEAEVDDLLELAAHRLRQAAEGARARGLEPAAEIFDRMAARVPALRDRHPQHAAAVRLRLHEVEQELVEALQRSTPQARLASMRDEAALRLAEYRARMTTPAFEGTVDRMVAEAVRDLYSMPRLTDF